MEKNSLCVCLQRWSKKHFLPISDFLAEDHKKMIYRDPKESFL